MTIAHFVDGSGGRSLDAEETALLRTWAPHLLSALDAVVDAYHADLVKAGLSPGLPDAEIEHLKAVRAAHWRHLLEGDLDAVRAAHAEHFGPHRLDRGLPHAVFPIAAEWFALGFLDRVDADAAIPAEVRPRLVRALVRAAFFDLAAAEATRHVAWID